VARCRGNHAADNGQSEVGATETVELALPPKRPDAVRYPQGIVARCPGNTAVSAAL
jgi:hypothetical protein